MKTKKALFGALVLSLVVSSVTVAHAGVTQQVKELIAGQSIDVGEFIVRRSLDGQTLIVDFWTVRPWQLLETAVYVSTEPPTRLSPGRFPYRHSQPLYPIMDRYFIPLSDLGVGIGDTIYIAGHAVVALRGDIYNSETAWAQGGWCADFFLGKGWGSYFVQVLF